MLGRAGEMIRPYIIAKKERLTFTSQVAVWGVERIFDMGSFARDAVGSLALARPERHCRFYHRLRRGMAFLLMALILAMIVGLIVSCAARATRRRISVQASLPDSRQSSPITCGRKFSRSAMALKPSRT